MATYDYANDIKRINIWLDALLSKRETYPNFRTTMSRYNILFTDEQTEKITYAIGIGRYNEAHNIIADVLNVEFEGVNTWQRLPQPNSAT